MSIPHFINIFAFCLIKLEDAVYASEFFSLTFWNIFEVGIPPVKTFLTYYKDDFILLTGKNNAELPLFVKKSIGAFWGMVFKFGLEYNGQKSVSVSMNEYFKVKTATYFTKSEV